MSADYQRIQQRIQAFDFNGLFTQELMWNHLKTRDLQIPVDGITYTLSPVAERGMAVYVCVPHDDAAFPKYPLRRKIDVQVSRTAREHIIIFHDRDKSVQIWQWVKKEAGKPSACREQIYYRGQSADALTQKVQGIAFELEDEVSVLFTGAKVKAAFDVEKVTKKFYDQFKKEHDAFLKFIKGIPEQDLQRWYVSVMLNRLMFIYFIQKKGFLSGDLNYLAGHLVESKKRGKDIFYSKFLCPLFFEGFAKREHQRTPETNRLLGRIPYLNGGLFLKHQIEELHGDKIEVPDGAFERIFDFFEQYDWHLDDRPTRTGREINPDVLGYVFEKYINQKEMGAYYSKEDITGYISKNTIIPALFDIARKSCRIAFEGEHSVWRLLQRDPDRYIYPAMLHGMERELPPSIAAGLENVSKRGDWNKAAPADYALPTETWRELVARRQRCAEVRAKLAAGEIRSMNELISYNLDPRRFAEEVILGAEGPELLRAFYKAIAGNTTHPGISVLDPACGSGAFLFAALNILQRLYEACHARMAAFVDDLDRSGAKHNPEKYSDFRKVLKEMNDKSRHPSSPYFVLKSIILNNLYGVDIMEEATEICKLRLFLKLAAQVNAAETIEPLPDIDFNIRAGNTLIGFVTRDQVKHAVSSKLDFDNTLEAIEEKAELVENAFRRFRQIQMDFGIKPEDFGEAKLDLRARLDKLRRELDGYLAGEYGVKESDRKQFQSWRHSHQPFHWVAEFYSIMRAGGFDVIIGNPPYVELSDVARTYSIKNLQLKETGNLYSVFVERFTALLCSEGRIGVIVPISSVTTPRMAALMTLVTETYSPLLISNFAVRPGKLFVGADMNLTIIIGQKCRKATCDVLTTSYNRWSSEARPFLFPTLTYYPSTFSHESSSIIKVGSRAAASIIEQLKSHQILGSFRTEHSGDLVYYHSGGRYFRKCLPEQLSNEYKELKLQKGFGKAAIAALSSSLYYFYWISISDCYHVTKRDVDLFPLPPALKDDAEILRLADILVEDLWKNAQTRKRARADGTIKDEVNFSVGKSKVIIDCIDRVLAKHYNLSQEQLDFVSNYDVKFRLTDVEE